MAAGGHRRGHPAAGARTLTRPRRSAVARADHRDGRLPGHADHRGQARAVPRSARPIVLFLFALLVVANAVAAFRLVGIVLGSGKIHGVELTANRLLTAGALVLGTNIVTFGLLYWQVDGGGPAGRAATPAPYPDFQFPQTVTTGLAAPGLAAPIPRPPLRRIHQPGRVQPHRHDATHRPGEGAHGDAVADLARRSRRRAGQGDQHPPIVT